MEKWLKFSLVILCSLSFFACKQMSDEQSKTTKLVKEAVTTTVNENKKDPQEVIVSAASKVKEDYNKNEWMEILEDSLTMLDIRYATDNNFTKQQIYDCARCFMRPVAGNKLLAFQAHMRIKYDLGIILYDCYRPRPYQQKLWDIVPDEKFVGNPAKGSMHNRGMAVDIGLIDNEGKILDMGTAFDHFGRESYHSATNISEEAIKNRKLLKNEIGIFGFKPITSEWWHYSYRENIGELSEWLWPCDENAN